MTSSDPGFVHLKVHSAYSLLEGALAISRLAELAVKDDMPALGLMDRNNLFGALEFSESLTKARIQPIVGISLDLVFANENEDISVYDVAGQNEREQVAGCLSILAKDEVGYKNLMALASAGYLTSNDHSGPCIRFEDLQNHAEGLIALTGGREGPLDVALRDGKPEQAQTYLTQLQSIFSGNLYVEIQRMGHPEDKQVEAGLLGLAYARDIPLVATNEVYFAETEDFEAHDALICISDGRYVAEDDRRRLTPEYRFKSRSEMMQLFADLPEALANTVEISKRSAFRPRTRDPILPQFVANSLSSEDNVVAAEAEELRKQAEEGLELRLEHHGMAPGISRADYRKRLAFELDVITRMKFPGYFLIVADFIKWSKAEGIPVGPGRGSGAGSLVAWSLTITDLDPLRFDLLFERFLNPERVSMPDFDIDFCQERRDEVIRYVQDKYGEDRVAQIITYGKLQARAVLRDVGRVLQMPYGQVDRLCKLVPNNPANPVTLEQAIEDEPRIREARESEPIVERLLNIGLKLEGLYRHASTHAAGVVIGDRKLTELVPLYQDSRSALPATQFNMKWVEAAGLVKFDFLGLKTLSVIEKTIQLIAERGEKIDPSLLPLDDRATYELMARGDTIGVFQLEGSGMRESLRKLKPDRFEDIIAMVALYRPGPMDNIETYINRKYEREEVDYLHPLIEPILKETYGVIIYQEQVMQVAQQLSGYSLGEADLLRRAMGKKIKSEMDSQKSRFIEGAMENSVDKSRAAFIFELVEKFAGYGFNKSHAAAYALLAYHTAYLKANYPVEFISASMTFDMGNTDKLNIFSQDARQLGIDILPPSINHSVVDFKPEGKAIRYSLAALKNVGRQSVVSLCREREANGHFESLLDFAERVNPKDINKRALENLAASGAFDDLSPNRAEVYDNVDVILATANKTNDDRTSGQNDLFGGGQQKLELTLKKRDKWLPMDQLGYEFDAVGFFLTGHPLDQYQTVISRLDCMTWIEIEEEARIEHTGGLIAATVVYKQERKSKSGNQFAFAAFSDQTGQFEAVVFSDTLNSSRELLEPGTAVLLRVDAEFEGESLKTRVISVESLDHAAERIQQTLQIVIDRPESLEQIKARVLQPGNGQLQLVAYLDDLDREVQITLPGKFDVSPRQAGLARTLSDILDVREC